jgi:hypothetical protein
MLPVSCGGGGLLTGGCLRKKPQNPRVAPASNGVATSSSPFQNHSQGDEDIASPKPFPKGGSVSMPCETKIFEARFWAMR